MSHYVPHQTVRSLLRRMIRRPWHETNGRILDYNNKLVAKVADEDSVETRLMTMAPEIALAYLDMATECDELRAEVERLAGRLEEAETEQRKSA